MITPSNTTATTNVTPSPLQQLAMLFQKSGITPNMQDSSAAAASQLPQNQPQQPAQAASNPQAGVLAKLSTVFPGLQQSLGMGTQQSWDGQSPQTSDFEGMLNMLNGTTINGTDQVTAQPSFVNSIYKMLP